MGFVDLATTWVIFLAIFARLGSDEAAMRFHGGRGDVDVAVKGKLRALTLWGSLAVASVIALIGYVAAPALREHGIPLDGWTLAGCSLGVIAVANLEVALALVRVERRRRLYLRASMGNAVLTAAGCVGAVYVLDLGVAGYLWANFAASLGTAAIVTYMQSQPGPRPHPPVADIPLARILRFAAPLIPAQACLFAFNIGDRAAIAAQLPGTSALGVYAGATKLAMLVIVAGRAMQLAAPPAVYATANETTTPRLLGIYALAMALVILAMTALAPLGVELLIAGSAAEKDEIVRVFPAVAAAWALWGATSVVSAGAGAKDLTSSLFGVALTGLVISTGTAVLLIPVVGVLGAALGLCAGYTWYLVRVAQASRVRLRECALPALVTAATAVLIAVTTDEQVDPATLALRSAIAGSGVAAILYIGAKRDFSA